MVRLARDAAVLDRALRKVTTAGLTAVGMKLNLAVLFTVRDALESLVVRFDAGDIPRIDVALPDAGVQYSGRRKTGAQGYDLTFSVDVIAQHMQRCGLEPAISVLPGATTPSTTARHAILIGSIGLLAGYLVGSAPGMFGAIFALLALQNVYTVLTAVTVHRALHNPVVLSNLGIAAIHAITLSVVLPGVPAMTA